MATDVVLALSLTVYPQWKSGKSTNWSTHSDGSKWTATHRETVRGLAVDRASHSQWSGCLCCVCVCVCARENGLNTGRAVGSFSLALWRLSWRAADECILHACQQQQYSLPRSWALSLVVAVRSQAKEQQQLTRRQMKQQSGEWRKCEDADW